MLGPGKSALLSIDGTARAAWRRLSTSTPPARTTPGQRAGIDAFLFALTFLGAVAAYTFQPFLRFAPAQGLLAGGVFLAFGIGPLLVARHARAALTLLWAALPMIALAIVVLALTARDAFAQSGWNDQRCWRIQRAMLHPGPNTRSDLAEVFTALACRPQGSAPTDRDYHPTHDRPADAAAAAAHRRYVQNALTTEVQTDVR